MVPPVNVLAVATAVPQHKLEQKAVADAARQVYARTFRRYPKLADVFVNVGIERRYSTRSLEWLSAPHDLAERTKVYLESASELFVQTAGAALERAGISARDVDVVVTVSSTGIATPSIEARVGPEMGFRPTVMRVPVFGRGCAGGVSGLALGARLARAEPGEIVLVVVIELARWPAASIAGQRPTLSPRLCLATAPRRRCFARGRPQRSCASARRPNTLGRARSTLWAG